MWKEAVIEFDGEEIERVESFEYLGARIEVNEKTTPEIRQRLAIATAKLNKIANIWKGQWKDTIFRILKSTTFPTTILHCVFGLGRQVNVSGKLKWLICQVFWFFFKRKANWKKDEVLLLVKVNGSAVVIRAISIEHSSYLACTVPYLIYISAACSSCFYCMWDLWCIHCYLDVDSAKLLATVLVSSCLDYCISVLYGITDTDLTKLQRQNQLARLVKKSPPFTHSVPLLCSLQGLPVRFEILFKIDLLTYI